MLSTVTRTGAACINWDRTESSPLSPFFLPICLHAKHVSLVATERGIPSLIPRKPPRTGQGGMVCELAERRRCYPWTKRPCHNARLCEERERVSRAMCCIIPFTVSRTSTHSSFTSHFPVCVCLSLSLPSRGFLESNRFQSLWCHVMSRSSWGCRRQP